MQRRVFLTTSMLNCSQKKSLNYLKKNLKILHHHTALTKYISNRKMELQLRLLLHMKEKQLQQKRQEMVDWMQ